MKHKFDQTNLQWGEMGLPSTAACSYYQCTACGRGFEHRYNEMPDIYQAMKEQNIDMDGCPKEDTP